jgi:ERCC4-type nuclease
LSFRDCRAWALRWRRLLAQLGSVERVMTADSVALGTVRGIGPRKAARIRELLTG